MREAIESNKLPIYANKSVRTPFSKKEVTQILNKIEKDTFSDFDPETYDEVIRVVETEKPLFPVKETVYQFEQDWIFDKNEQELTTKLTAINVGHWSIADKFSINAETLQADFTIKNKVRNSLSIENKDVTWAKTVYTIGVFNEKTLRQALLSKEYLLKHKVVNANDYSHVLEESLIAMNLQGSVDTLLDLKIDDPDPKINVVQEDDWSAENLFEFKVVQDIYYDEKNQCFQTKIIAIAPLIPQFDDGGNFTYYMPLFYIVYDDVFLRNH